MQQQLVSVVVNSDSRRENKEKKYVLIVIEIERFSGKRHGPVM